VPKRTLEACRKHGVRPRRAEKPADALYEPLPLVRCGRLDGSHNHIYK
jgi:hypothetical protein